MAHAGATGQLLGEGMGGQGLMCNAIRFTPAFITDELPICADCDQPIEGTPHLAGDLGHDDAYGPVPTVTICSDCLESRRSL